MGDGTEAALVVPSLDDAVFSIELALTLDVPVRTDRLRGVDRKILALHIYERLHQSRYVLMRKPPIPLRPDPHYRPHVRERED